MTNGKVFVQLGRNGDIYSILPILYNEYLTHGTVQKVIVAAEYRNALSGLDFAEPIIYDGPWVDFFGAIRFAKTSFDNVLYPMAFGQGFPILYKCPSFQLEHWRRCGYLRHWGDLPMPAIKRDRGPVKRFIPKRPYVLFADHGISGPFVPKDRVAAIIKETLPDYELLRLSEVRVPRPIDLLPLYDEARVMVTTDTMHLHLSIATDTPVLCFNSGPSRLNASAYHTRFRVQIRYADVDRRMPAFVEELKNTAAGRRHDPQLIHVWSNGSNPFDAKTDATRRIAVARRTWELENQNNRWVDCPFPITKETETALKIGDARDLPCVNDMIDFAARGRHHKDIIVLTNSDTCFSTGLTQVLLERVAKKGAVYSHRWDFAKLGRPLTVEEIKKGGRFYPGSDLFAFDIGWWICYRLDIPRMFLGAEWWDCVFRHMVRQTGGGELMHAIYHEKHESFWEKNRGSPANVHNANTCRDFMGKWALKD